MADLLLLVKELEPLLNSFSNLALVIMGLHLIKVERRVFKLELLKGVN